MDPSVFTIPDRYYPLRDPNEINLNQREDIDPPGLKCELKAYESRYNARGEKVLLDAGSVWEMKIPNAQDHDSALVLIRHYDKERDLERTTLFVQSPYLKKALRMVIKMYPSVNLDGPIVMTDLPKCLFHYRTELKEYADELVDRSHAEHIYFAIRYMELIMPDKLWNWHHGVERWLDGQRQTNGSRKQKPSPRPGLIFEDLWMAFRPGCLVYSFFNGEERVWRLETMQTSSKFGAFGNSWMLYVKAIVYDGNNFGYQEHKFEIQQYEGHIPFMKLRVSPVEYHENIDDIMARMVTRGKKYVSLRGVHPQEYNGIARGISPFRQRTFVGEVDYFFVTVHSGRVMVDAETFSLRNPGNVDEIENLEIGKMPQGNEDEPVFDDADFAICCDEVVGFSLANKQWCHFKVDLIREVEYNVSAFEALVLPKLQKDMIHSLVKAHAEAKLAFDLIKGKGKGMISLLHGVPETGKTLAAESISEYTKRPLYAISSGELGSDTNNLEKNLFVVLELAGTWNAIVLIDEADVFLEQRNVSDPERNGLVSTFLRLLEYYEGILFLATNRVRVFDKAFNSRIHLAVKYHPLAPAARSQLWEHFIRSTYPAASLTWLDNDYLHHLGAVDLNGREIKNAFRTCHALAIDSGKAFSKKHMDAALEGIRSFTVDFQADQEDAEDSELRAGKRRRLE